MGKDTEQFATTGAHDSTDVAALSENLRIRSMLMARLRDLMAAQRLTQVQAARWFNVSQSRVSHLVNGRLNRFTTDSLINMLAHTGARVSVEFDERDNAHARSRASSRTEKSGGPPI